MTRTTLTRFAWATLAFNVVVVVMGAAVRATGSGAGCGRSWPTCQGQMIPALEGATAVEFAHRAVSGVALILVLALFLGVRRRFPAPNQIRTTALVSLIAIVVEALIGAVIVLFEWVGDDASVARVVSVPLHLVNTFFLLAALTTLAYQLGGGGPLRIHRHRNTTRSWLLGAGVFLVVAATGAVTALADTLFPRDGLGADEVEHFLTDLRILHPITATVMVALAVWVVTRPRVEGRWVNLLTLLIAAQVASGILVISTGLALGMRLAHLALADGLWVVYVLAGLDLLTADGGPGRPRMEPADDSAGERLA